MLDVRFAVRTPLSASAFCKALALATLVGLAACSKANLSDVTGSIRRPAGADVELPKDEASLRLFAEEWGRRYESNRKDKQAAMTYARALRALDRTTEAVAVLQGTAIQNPNDMKVLSTYGKALVDAGRLQEASDVLAHADTPDRPDWSVQSTRGQIADELGNHEAARAYYQEALKQRPDDPGVLSNLGLSYALSRQLSRAEETLTRAARQPTADMRVRQNLALVLALQGKFEQAEEWARHDLSPIDAAANIAQIREMISQSNTWRDIQAGATPAPRRAATAAARPVQNPAQ
ncbi:MAG TPA: tetratricopeptide repeat protein [Methylocystis sp.]|nr:tetratricopeptide repeat protein [Methylocystis sp.]